MTQEPPGKVTRSGPHCRETERLIFFAAQKMTISPSTSLEAQCPVCCAPSQRYRSFGEYNYRICLQRGCGHVFLGEIPSEKTLAAFYDTCDSELWNSQAFAILGDYLTNPVTIRRYYERERTQHIRRVFGSLLAPGNRVLDVGCSSGVFLATLRDLGLDVHGQEIAPPAVAAGRERLEIDLFNGSIGDYPLESPFNLVTSYDVIEHVPDPRTFLRHIRRLCAPGAGIVLRTPNHASWLRWLTGKRWLWYLPPAHIHLFNTASLTRLLHEAGFRSVSVRTDASTYLYFLAHYLHRGKAVRVSLNLPRWKESLIFGLDDALRAAGFPLLLAGHLLRGNPLIEVFATAI